MQQQITNRGDEGTNLSGALVEIKEILQKLHSEGFYVNMFEANLLENLMTVMQPLPRKRTNRTCTTLRCVEEITVFLRPIQRALCPRLEMWLTVVFLKLYRACESC